MSRVQRAFPLTPLQEGMLWHTVREPTSGLYHGQVDALLRGALDETRFRAAWRTAMGRHEAFRTVFAWERRERPLQVVLHDAPLPMRFLDWRGLDDAARAARWNALLEKDRAEPFDLMRAPLMRWVVVRWKDDEHRLLWSVHHALADGWSALSVLGEILVDHDRPVGAPAVARPEAPNFAQFVGWLETRDTEAARRHWTRELAGVGTTIALPYAPTGPGGSRRVRTELTLTGADTAAAVAAASRLRVTLNTLLVAAWSRVLARRTGRDDVVFGVTSSERPTVIPAIESAVGLYLSTVPVRVRSRPDERVGAWLARMQTNLAEGREHGAPGLAEIQRWSGVRDGPLINSLVVFESFPGAVEHAVDGGSLEVVDLSMAVPSDLPLALLAYPGERLRLVLCRDPDALSADTAGGLLRQVAAEFAALQGDPGRTMADLDAASGSAASGAGGGSPVRGPELDEAPVDVLALVEAQARDRPDAIAVVGPDGSLTYGQLDAWADAVSRRLTAVGGGPERFVAVLAGRVPEAIVGMLAALKARCAYISLDPDLPTARLAAMASAADLAVTTAEHEGRLPPRVPRVVVGRDPESAQAAERMPPAEREPSADAAYAIFTSGSTGTPKAVVVERRQLAWSTAARLQYFSEHPGVFLLLSPISVDSATAGIYWALCAGGTLVLPPPRAEQDVEELGRMIAREGVTHTLLVPSLYHALLDHVDVDRLATLRVVVVAGEACRDEVARAHRRTIGHVALFNEYGPSEATVWATADDLSDRSTGTVTIGRPVPGVRIHLLDDDGREVDEGRAGEIGISGPGVARGYLGRPELTAERFVEGGPGHGPRIYRTGDRGRWRADGRLQFLGRVDDQVKIRGHRVEVGEIESVLSDHPSVREAVVALVDSDGGPPDIQRLISLLLDLEPDDRLELIAQAEAME